MRYTDCWYKQTCKLFPDSCSATCLRFSQMLYLLQQSNLPSSRWFPQPLYPGIDKSQFLALNEIRDDIADWVAEGNNLYIYSKYFGNGKTSWAIKLMLAYFNEIWPGNAFKIRGIFVSVPEFLDRTREVINNRDPEFVELRKTMLSCDLVIWDDISSTKLTDFNHSVLFNYIDARMVNNKSNIFTGNVTESGLIEFLGGRLASRIWNTSELIQFSDRDKRGIE